MVLKYTVFAVSVILLRRVCDNREEGFCIIFYTMNYTLSPIYHWIYASQYLKTCLLVPNLAQKAKLILERHHTAIKNGLDIIASVPEFVQSQN